MKTEKEKSSEEYVRSWERQIRLIEMNETLLKKAKEKIKRAINFLRKEFGEDFLINPINNSHFLVRKLIHMRDVTLYQWILWFVDSYKLIKLLSSDNDELIKKLRNELGDPNTALVELIHIDKFLRSNYFESNLYPKRKKDGAKKSKHPELEVKIKHNNFIFDVEIKELQPKEGLKAFFKTWMLLHESFFIYESKRIYFTFSIVLITPDIHPKIIEQIRKQIELDILEVVENKTVKYYEKEHLIKYVIGHVFKQEEIENWCQVNNSALNQIILIPNLLEPAIASVKGKIQKDIMEGNLAYSKYGLGIINNQNLVSLNDLEGEKDFRKIIVNIQQTILNFPNLIGIILSSGLYYTLKPQISTKNDDYAIIHNDNDPNNLYYIIIWNSNFNFPFSETDKQGIIDAFKSDTTTRIHKIRKNKILFYKS